MFVQLFKCLKVLKVLTTLLFIFLPFYACFQILPSILIYSILLRLLKTKRNSSYINNIPTGEHVVILCIVAAT